MDDQVNQWILDHDTRYYQDLGLEGNGVIRKEQESRIKNKFLQAEDRQPVLAFDFGDEYMSSPGYRQYQDIRALFAWMELKFGHELAPSLLDGMAEIHQLNHHEQERLRLMLMNFEKPKFIQKALGFNEGNFVPLARFIADVQTGPVYTHHHGPSRTTKEFSLGVELSSQGELILKYVKQHDQASWGGYEETARFSPSDLDLMRSLTYGPLLK